MKKFLSLVLALVMTMSLVTISAGAKDFADADDITYVEAVDVLSTLGVLLGDETGFRPTDTLKRSEAAKIICALNLTPKTADTLTADTAPFADVPASHWAAGFIAEGVQSGIIAGKGDNKFDPDGKLTGYEFLKMLLVSLGYDAAIEGMTGANWSINVAKLADELELTKGNDDFVGSAAITREEAALYALNTLKATMVDYEDKGTQITINGAVIATGASKASIVTGTKTAYSNISATSVTNAYGNTVQTVEFAEKHFSKLTLGTGYNTDNFGRPTNVWVYDGKKIGSYESKNPVLVLTETTKEKDIYSALGAEGISGTYAKYVVMDAIYEDGVAVDLTSGAYAEAAVIAKGDKSNTVGTGNGVTVEIYKTSTANHYTMVVIHEYITKVTGIVKADNAAETKRAIKTGYGNFETEDFAKNDWVLVTLSQGVVKSAALAEKLTDLTVSAYNGTTSVTADGTTYKYSQIKDELERDGSANKAYEVDGSETYTFYLDSNGYIIKNGVYTASNTDWNLVLNVSSTSKDDGFGGDVYYQYKLLNAAGEVEVVKAMANATTVNGTTTYSATAAQNTIVTYKDDSDNDGYVKFTTLGDYSDATSSTATQTSASVTGFKKTTASIGGIAVNNSTTFVLQTGNNSYKVVEGLSNLDTYTNLSTTAYAVMKSGVAKLVFVDVRGGDASTDADELVYIVKSSYSTGYDSTLKDNIYTYTTTDGTLTATTNGYAVGLYKITATEGGYAKTLVEATSGKYEKVGVNGEVKVSDGVLTVVGGSSYVLADDVDVTMIDADDVVTTECDADELVDETVKGTLYLVKKSTTNDTVVAIYFDGTVG